jgi:hypothetical protein
MLFEERDDPLFEVLEPGDRVGHDRARRTLVIHVSTPEMDAETFQQLTLVRVLGHLERGSELPPPRASGISRIDVDGYRKAAFAIDEPDDPARIELLRRDFGFLLIVRTGRVFTFHEQGISRATDMNEYRRILGCSSI